MGNLYYEGDINEERRSDVEKALECHLKALASLEEYAVNC
jgi:hypothetical protein